ncbi:MAG: histidine ammonia-lyase [Bacteroidetes bacterium]|uniref:Histidine ammonia-lyase n=1 Tax=Candidatus Cryptobacteroides merdavium TaxID=2840769 RepID=A0A9D9HCH9_9BACT|nr:histidine ammonia-lyase [Candidatus Cryptobacteroides merdavium]
MVHQISNRCLSIDKIKEILTKGYTIEISSESEEAVIKCREYLDSKMEDMDRPVYGVTTGFGSLCNITIPAEDLSALQHNLVMSHACGTGDTVSPEIVKLMLLLKIQSLAYGHSGVQLATIQRLVDMFNNDVLPVVYQQGSLGASGDLAPLAHLSLPLIGLGEVEYKGQRKPSAEVWAELGWEPLKLQSKEGLALLNGTQFMSAHGVWAIIRCERLSEWADRIGAMSLDAYDGRIEPFYPQVHAVRRHKGQADTAARIMELLEGSEIISRKKTHVQDPYSFRCIPQVHGAVKDTIRYVKSVVETEINSATDNPTVFPDQDLIISAGNFHGEPIALAMDFLAVAMSELASISERRIYRLIAGQRELPSFLVANPGLNSGFMIPQYTAASIVSQNKGLCMPASADSIPSSQGQEDHVSMGANAATKLVRVVDNTERVLAIELFNAAQALEFRRPLHSSWTIEKIYAHYRKEVPFVNDDTYMHPLIEKSVKFLREYNLVPFSV